jgi:hypothetical protein
MLHHAQSHVICIGTTNNTEQTMNNETTTLKNELRHNNA